MEKILKLFEDFSNKDEVIYKLKVKIENNFNSIDKINAGIYIILEDIVPILFSDSNKYRLFAIKFIQLTTSPYRDYGLRGNHVDALKKQLQENFRIFEKFDEAIKNENDEWCLFWCCIIRLFGTKLHTSPLSLVNQLLGIVQKAFKCSSNMNRQIAFLCWTELIWNFSLDINELCSPKRLKLLLIPLGAKLICKTKEIAVAKFEAWWLLLSKIVSKMDIFYEQVLHPFLNLYFGPFLSNATETNSTMSKYAQCGCRHVEHIKKCSANALLQLVGHKSICSCPESSYKIKLNDTIFSYGGAKVLESIVHVSKTFITSKELDSVRCLWYQAFIFFALEKKCKEQNLEKEDLFSSVCHLFSQLNDCDLIDGVTIILAELKDHTYLRDISNLKLFYNSWTKSTLFLKQNNIKKQANKKIFNFLFSDKSTSSKISLIQSFDLDLQETHFHIRVWPLILENISPSDWFNNPQYAYSFIMKPLKSFETSPMSLPLLENDGFFETFFPTIESFLQKLLNYTFILDFLLTSSKLNIRRYQDRLTVAIENICNIFLTNLDEKRLSKENLSNVKLLVMYFLKQENHFTFVIILFQRLSNDFMLFCLQDQDFVKTLSTIKVSLILQQQKKEFSKLFTQIVHVSFSLNDLSIVKTILEGWINSLRYNTVVSKLNRNEFILNCINTFNDAVEKLMGNCNSDLKIVLSDPNLSFLNSTTVQSEKCDYVTIESEWVFKPELLTEDQKDKIKNRGKDIPALYEDATQSNSEDMFNAQKIISNINNSWKHTVTLNTSKSGNVKISSNDISIPEIIEISPSKDEKNKISQSVTNESVGTQSTKRVYKRKDSTNLYPKMNLSEKAKRELKRIIIPNNKEYSATPKLINFNENQPTLRPKSVITYSSPARQVKRKKDKIENNETNTKVSKEKTKVNKNESPKEIVSEDTSKTNENAVENSDPTLPRLVLKLSRRKDRSFERSDVLDTISSKENIDDTSNDCINKESSKKIISPPKVIQKISVSKNLEVDNNLLTKSNCISDNTSHNTTIDSNNFPDPDISSPKTELHHPKKIPTDEEMMLVDLASTAIAPVSIRPNSLDLQNVSTTKNDSTNSLQDTQPVSDSLLNSNEIDNVETLKNDSKTFNDSVLTTSMMNSPLGNNNGQELMTEFLNNTSDISPIKSDPITTNSQVSNVNIVDPLEISPNIQKKITYVSNRPPELLTEENIKEETDNVQNLTDKSKPSNNLKPKSFQSFSRSAKLLKLVPGAKSVSSFINTTDKKTKVGRPRKMKGVGSSRSEQILAKSLDNTIETSGIIEIEEKRKKKLEILVFEKELPSPTATPSSSIIKSTKRKHTDKNEEHESPVAKRKRVSFLDPPVSCEKLYLPENVPKRTSKKKRMFEEDLSTESDNNAINNSLEDDNEDSNNKLEKTTKIIKNLKKIDKFIEKNKSSEMASNSTFNSNAVDCEHLMHTEDQLVSIEQMPCNLTPIKNIDKVPNENNNAEIANKTSKLVSKDNFVEKYVDDVKQLLYSKENSNNLASRSFTSPSKETEISNSFKSPTKEIEISNCRSTIQLNQSHTSWADMIIQQCKNDNEKADVLRDYVELIGIDVAFKILNDKLEFRHLVYEKSGTARLLEAMKFVGFTNSTESYLNYAISTVGEERTAKQILNQLEKFPKAIATINTLQLESNKMLENQHNTTNLNKDKLTKTLAEFSKEEILEIIANVAQMKNK